MWLGGCPCFFSPSWGSGWGSGCGNDFNSCWGIFIVIIIIFFLFFGNGSCNRRENY